MFRKPLLVAPVRGLSVNPRTVRGVCLVGLMGLMSASRVAHAEGAASPPVGSPAPAAPAVSPGGAGSVGAPDTAPGDSPPAVAPTPAPVPALPPAPASATTPAPAVSAAPPPRAVTSPGEAVVHVAVSHKDAWLEMRSYVDGGPFLRICPAPCDIKLQVDGREARVTATGMTTSNVFRIDGGDGTAGVRVEGGSANSRRAGILTLAIGIPVALAGMGLFAQGRMKDSKGLTAAGIAGLSAGGLSIAVSLPLLLIGTTHVKNAKGSLIALSKPVPAL